MSKIVTTTRYETFDTEFRDKLLDLIIGDGVKRNEVALMEDDRFVEELARQFRKIQQFQKLMYQHKNDDLSSLSINMDEETRLIYDKMCLVAASAKNSLHDCELYALFLYLSDSLRNPILFRGWIFQWLIEVVKRYKKEESVILKFVYGFAIDYCELFETLFGKLAKYNFHESDLPYNDRIGLPDSDTSGFFIRILRQDYKQIVNIQRKYIRLEEESLSSWNEGHGWLIEHFGKLVFPEVSGKALIDLYISFLHARLANYLVSASHSNEDRIKCKKELKEALKHYQDNSYAIALQASLMVKEDPYGSAAQIEDRFEKALQLAEGQYVGLHLRTEIRVMAMLGLAYVYTNRGKYDMAERYCNEALELKPEAYLKAVIYLNRGRARIDDNDLIGAEEDFSESLKEPLLEHHARCNLGLVYYKQGLYDKAEDELNESIDKCPALPHAYYNLGVLYNEDGKKQQAEKLFRTALNIDRDFKEARVALKRLHHSRTDALTDWVDWWFGSGISKIRKVMGVAIVLLLGAVIGKAGYTALQGDKDIPQSIFIMIGISIVLLLLPCISKLKFGLIELEMESKGESPTLK
jgi:tetratricopeptide (TPR) repeat protein